MHTVYAFGFSRAIRTAFKPLKTLGHVFKKPKDRPTKEQLKEIVYKVSFRICPFTYVEESKRSWKSWGLSTSLEVMGILALR